MRRYKINFKKMYVLQPKKKVVTFVHILTLNEQDQKVEKPLEKPYFHKKFQLAHMSYE